MAENEQVRKAAEKAKVARFRKVLGGALMAQLLQRHPKPFKTLEKMITLIKNLNDDLGITHWVPQPTQYQIAAMTSNTNQQPSQHQIPTQYQIAAMPANTNQQSSQQQTPTQYQMPPPQSQPVSYQNNQPPQQMQYKNQQSRRQQVPQNQGNSFGGGGNNGQTNQNHNRQRNNNRSQNNTVPQPLMQITTQPQHQPTQHVQTTQPPPSTIAAASAVQKKPYFEPRVYNNKGQAKSNTIPQGNQATPPPVGGLLPTPPATQRLNPTPAGPANNTPNPTPPDLSQRKCYRCNQTGHLARDCPTAKELDQRRIGSLVCTNCKGRGHTFDTCTNPPRFPVADGIDHHILNGTDPRSGNSSSPSMRRGQS